MVAVASISDRVGDLGEYLREQREHARLSVRQLATLAGVSNPYLSQVERGLRKPSAEVLQQIARGLRISAEALYVRAGILDEEGRPDVEAAVGADPDLNDRQRRVLLDIYASFRAENRRTETEAVATEPAARATRTPRAARTPRTPRTPRAATSEATASEATTSKPASKMAASKAAASKAASKAAASKVVSKAASKRAAARTTRAARKAAPMPPAAGDAAGSAGTTS